MSLCTKTINIIAKDLGGSSAPTLILTFDDQPMTGIYENYFPVVWKRSTFPTKGSYALTAEYTNQLMFVNSQVDDNKVFFGFQTWVDIDLGKQTDLIENSGSATKSFTTPVTGPEDKVIKAINKTPTPQTIGVGFNDGGAMPQISLVFEDIGSSYNVTSGFAPILSAYITAEHPKNSVIRGAIQPPAIWKQNLAALKRTTDLRLERDPVSGKYSITPASS